MFKHAKSNANIYFPLLLAFIIGVSAGAFTVNGLSVSQRAELANYFTGFIQLLGNQRIDSSELLKVSIIENLKIVSIIWILGLTIIGIPFIFIIVGIRGFITGFSAGFIVEALGMKGVIFTLCSLLPKEIIIIPCIIALGVNGVNFSLKMIKNKSKKHLSKDNLKTNILAYCFLTLFFSSFIFIGILVEAYITPVFIRMITPVVIK
jgi:stage II sporulation protein M